MKTPYPAPKNKPYTNEQVKNYFKKSGVTVALWAKENNFPVDRVYLVINGYLKGNYGVAHEIAISLGLKIEEVA